MDKKTIHRALLLLNLQGDDSPAENLAEFLDGLARKVEALEAKLAPPKYNLGGPEVDIDEAVRAMKEREARERLKGGAQ